MFSNRLNGQRTARSVAATHAPNTTPPNDAPGARSYHGPTTRVDIAVSAHETVISRCDAAVAPPRVSNANQPDASEWTSRRDALRKRREVAAPTTPQTDAATTRLGRRHRSGRRDGATASCAHATATASVNTANATVAATGGRYGVGRPSNPANPPTAATAAAAQ